MSETPSARIVRDARKATVVTDADGRKITFRSLNVLDQARLFKAAREHSENPPYMRLLVIAASAADIDGVPCPFPNSPDSCDAAIGKLGDAGYMALVAIADMDTAASVPETGPEQLAAVKN